MATPRTLIVPVLPGMLVFLAGTSGLFGAEPIDVKRDVPLQTVWYRPHKTPGASGNDGFLAGSFSWYVYPEVAQTFRKDRKGIFIKIEIAGPLNFSSAALSFSIDGEVINIPEVAWTLSELLGGTPEAETLSPDSPDFIRKIAGAKEVWLTVFGDVRHSVRLNPKQLAVFRLMIERYDSIEPK